MAPKVKISLEKNAKVVLDAYFVKKNDRGEALETPEQFFRRIAKAIAFADIKYTHKTLVEKALSKNDYEHYDFWLLALRDKDLKSSVKKDKDLKETEEEFYDLLSSLDFLPNSPTLFNCGTKSHQLVSCFAVPIEDTMDSIFDGLHKTAIIHQSGAGASFSFSQIRPRGDAVSSAGVASGPVSFMNIFNTAAQEMRDGGKRRALNSVVLSSHHPSVNEFIVDAPKLQAISSYVGVTEKFLRSQEKDQNVQLVNPRTQKIVERVKAKELFTNLCTSISEKGNLHVAFVDTINKHNPTPGIGKIEILSPFGESTLLPNEACVLGSLNLSHMITEGEIDWEKLQKRVWQAVHFLDNVIDLTDFKYTEIFVATHQTRKIGLGVMGWADLLSQLRIKYNSEKALKLAEEVMGFINDHAKKASVSLAQTRGVFPLFRKSVYSKKKEDKVRNASRTAIAQTNMISVLAGCSRGIEPIASVLSTKKVFDHELVYLNKHFVSALQDEGVYSDDLIEKVKLSKSLKNLFIPAWTKRVYASAKEIQPEWHVKMQAAFQKHCDQGVAKKIHFDKESSAEKIHEVLLLSHALMCKTFYVDKLPKPPEPVIKVEE